MIRSIIRVILFIPFFLPVFKANAQDADKYFLMPYLQSDIAIGEKMDFSIYRYNADSSIIGTDADFANVILPEWTLNGNPAGASSNGEGSLSANLTRITATYQAPDKVPKINPVLIAVKFRSNAQTKEMVTLICSLKIIDPGQHWFFAYVCSKESKETMKSSFRDVTKTTKAVGSASMLLDATPPEKNGYVLVNTEQGDKAINTKVNGFYNYHEDDIRKAPNGNTEERDLRNYAGTPVQNQSLLFEYDPSLKGFKGGIQGAGISFDVTGTDEFWREDANSGKLKKTINKVSEKNSDGVGLGSNDDNIKKIKNGFSIDFNHSNDSSYTDIEGAKHSIQSKKQYHAVLLWVNKE